jgi:hypothetical protein
MKTIFDDKASSQKIVFVCFIFIQQNNIVVLVYIYRCSVSWFLSLLLLT